MCKGVEDCCRDAKARRCYEYYVNNSILPYLQYLYRNWTDGYDKLIDISLEAMGTSRSKSHLYESATEETTTRMVRVYELLFKYADPKKLPGNHLDNEETVAWHDKEATIAWLLFAYYAPKSVQNLMIANNGTFIVNHTSNAAIHWCNFEHTIYEMGMCAQSCTAYCDDDGLPSPLYLGDITEFEEDSEALSRLVVKGKVEKVPSSIIRNDFKWDKWGRLVPKGTVKKVPSYFINKDAEKWDRVGNPIRKKRKKEEDTEVLSRLMNNRFSSDRFSSVISVEEAAEFWKEHFN